MTWQLTKQCVEACNWARISTDHIKRDIEDRKAAKDQDHNLNNVGQRNRFQAAIDRVEHCENGEASHSRNDRDARYGCDGEPAQPENGCEVHESVERDPEHRHDRFDLSPETCFEELRHREDFPL